MTEEPCRLITISELGIRNDIYDLAIVIRDEIGKYAYRACKIYDTSPPSNKIEEENINKESKPDVVPSSPKILGLSCEKPIACIPISAENEEVNLFIIMLKNRK